MLMNNPLLTWPMWPSTALLFHSWEEMEHALLQTAYPPRQAFALSLPMHSVLSINPLFISFISWKHFPAWEGRWRWGRRWWHLLSYRNDTSIHSRSSILSPKSSSGEKKNTAWLVLLLLPGLLGGFLFLIMACERHLLPKQTNPSHHAWRTWIKNRVYPSPCYILQACATPHLKQQWQL